VVAKRIEAAKAYGARRRRAESEQCLDDGRLAGPVGSEHGHDLAVVHVQRHVVNGGEVAEGDHQVTDLDSVAHDL
jgi:hypothetical protein